jgi:ABC-type nitrate/sulfonate/bicarbonate transport system substrate-binding protein
MHNKVLEICVASALAVLTASSALAADKFGEIKIASPGPNITTLPMQVAVEKGWDKQEGFTATIGRATGSIAIKALIAGDFDFALSVGGGLTAAVSGAPVKVIYVHAPKALHSLYAREGIVTMKDLEGKKVGIDIVGSTQDDAFRRAMIASGADPSKSTVIALGYQNIPASLIAGAIDAGVFAAPIEYQLDKSSKKFAYLGFLGDFVPGITGGVVTTERMTRQKPELLRAVMRAHSRAHKFIIEDRAGTLPIMAKFLNLSEAEAARAYDTVILPHFNRTGMLPSDLQQKVIAAQATALKVSKPPAPAKIFDFSFLGK